MGEAAREAAAGVARRGDGATELGRGAGGDITTVLDKAIEDAVMSLVPEGTSVLAEEAGEVGPADGGTTLVIDPLDGSHNASRGIPAYSISIAAVSGELHLGNVEAAYVRHLVTGDEWTAAKGTGTLRDGRTVRPSSSLHTIATELYPSRKKVLLRSVAPLGLATKVRGIGTVAIDLAYVADGTVDAFVDLRGLGRTFDLAAGYLLVKEAGGLVTDERGRDLADRPCALDARCNVIAAGTAECVERIVRAVPPE